METELKDLWVVENSLLSHVPRIEHYMARDIRENGATVVKRGSVHVIKAAAGRRFFSDKAALSAYIRRVLETNKASLERQAARIGEILALRSISYDEVPHEVPCKGMGLPPETIELD